MTLKMKNTGKNNVTKSWFCEKINKIDKLLVRMTKRKKRDDTNYQYQE